MRKGNETLSPSMASLRARELAAARWGKVRKADRVAHADRMNDAYIRRLMDEHGIDEAQALSMQKAHLMAAARKSVEVRRAKRNGRNGE